MKIIIKYILLILISFLFVSCAKTPYTKRSQFIMMDVNQEMRLGLQEAKKILKSEKISRDRRKTAMVKRVGKKIAKVSAQNNFKWEFFLIDKDILNAFCLPGGKVFVYKGIFKAVKNEDQLAVVMGHEIAHALARHGAERMSMVQLSNIGKNILTKTLGGSKYANIANIAYGMTQNYGLVLPYSRKFEYEADEIGLYLMTKAGYNPKEAIKFWQNMRKLKNGNNPPTFLSTHPADYNRIKKLKKLIPKALKYYK